MLNLLAEKYLFFLTLSPEPSAQKDQFCCALKSEHACISIFVLKFTIQLHILTA